MTQASNLDLSRGHKEYDSKVKNLEGILTKVEKILDVSLYRKELQQVKNDVSNNPEFDKKMATSNMQMDYEGFVFATYIKRLDDLTKRIEEEMLPFYELYLLYSKIDIQLAEINADSIGDIILNTKKLIDILNSLNTHNDKIKNSLITNAYNTVYSVIIYEERFERSDILDYINHLNIASNKENIGRLLEFDLKKLMEEDLIDEDLRAIRTEGLGYDYLTSSIVGKISSLTVGDKNSQYQEKKKKAISELSEKISLFNNEKEKNILEQSNNNKKIKMLYINKAWLATKALSIILVPIITFSAGKSIGKKTSDNITEYKTITRTIDAQTGDVVGDIQFVYDDNETTYVATVMKYDPWRKNPTGIGYIRNVTAYEYIVPESSSSEYHPTVSQLEENTYEKYKFIESKDELENGDSTTDATILITETYQDKSDSRKSTKFIIPGAIIGASIGITIDVILVLLQIYDIAKIKRMMSELSDEIRKYRLSNEEIRDRLIQMKDEAIALQEEYGDIVKKYGTLGEQFIINQQKINVRKKH